MGKYRDLAGQRHNRLTVIMEVPRPDGKKTRRFWLVRCDCGKEMILSSSDFNRPSRYSCGCYQRDSVSKRAYEQHITHGKSKSRLYSIWSSMKQRCFDRNVKTYHMYGGRGISVCSEWKDNFPSFEKWALDNGYDESLPRGQCTIDRIDVNGDYCPENCRIATQKQQSNNRRNNHTVTYRGETHTLSEWSQIVGIKQSILGARLSYGWKLDRVFCEPPKEVMK